MEFSEFADLLGAPGMGAWSRIMPALGLAGWLWLTVLLWRGGFTDLVEQLTRPRFKGPHRAHALIMFPLRALMLALAAAFGAGSTAFGIWIQGAILLNVWQAVQAGG